MSLTLGSTSLHLFSNTTSYSDNDIIIEIPEEHTLIVGDIFNKNRLPWLDSKTDFTFMNKLFASYISDSSTVYNFIGGHGYGMTKNEIKEQLNYINELKANVDSLKKEGKTISETKIILAIKTFKFLTNYNPLFNGTSLNLHEMNIEAIWKQK